MAVFNPKKLNTSIYEMEIRLHQSESANETPDLIIGLINHNYIDKKDCSDAKMVGLKLKNCLKAKNENGGEEKLSY